MAGWTVLAAALAAQSATAGPPADAAPAAPRWDEPGVRIEAAAQTACLDLGYVIDRSAREDPRIAQAREGVARGRADLAIARGGFLPQVNAFSRLGQGENSFRAESQVDNRVGVRGSQLLWDFGRTDARRDAARARLAGAGYREDLQVADVALEAAMHHLGVSRAERRAEAAAGLSGHFRRQLATLDEQLAAGLLKRSEAAAIRAEALRGFAAENEERLRAEQERTALRTLVQQPVGCVDAASADLWLARAVPASLPTALDEAIADSPELQAAEQYARAARYELREEKAAQWPELRLGGTAAYDFGLGSDPRGQSNRIGLELAMPIFEGHVGAKTRARRADARAAEFEVEQQRRKLIESVTLAWSRVEKLGQIAKLQDEAVTALADQADALDQEFASRLVTVNEVTDARRNEYQMRLTAIDTRYQLRVEQLNLLRDTGRLSALAAPQAR